MVFSPSSPVFYSKTDYSKPTGFNDFIFYYGAAILSKQGNSDKIYSQELQQENLSNIVGVPVKKLIPYLYPPQSLLFFAPLANFSLTNSFFIWQTANILGTLLLITILYYSGICTTNYRSSLVTTTLIITCYPWINAIIQGQVVILMTIGLLGYHLLAKHNHMLIAGILVVVTAFKPPLIIAPVLYLLIIHGKSLFYSTIASTIAVMVICSVLFGISIWQSYIDIMRFASTEIGTGASLEMMANIRSLVFLFAGEQYLPLINLVITMFWAGSVIGIIILAYSLKNKPINIQELGFGLSIAISCVASPWLHIYSLFLLIIPVGYLAKHSDLKPNYLYIGGLINFSLFAMFLDGIAPRFNCILWVPAQLILIFFIIGKISQSIKKSSL